MSNLIPYFVLAVVALGFFAVCYAVFSGGDGESKAKEKSYKNISNKNNSKEYNDVIFATESQEGMIPYRLWDFGILFLQSYRVSGK